MTLTDRVAKLERAPKPEEWNEPPLAKTWAEWLASAGKPQAPLAPGAKVRGFVNAPPVAASIAEWTAQVMADIEARGR